MKVLFVNPNRDTFGYKLIGLSLLSAIARNLGWDTRLFDTTEIDFGVADSKEILETAKIYRPVDFSKYGLQKKKVDLSCKAREVLEEYNPDLLAFSVMSDQFLVASQISKIAKDVNPKLPIIWGGAYPTLNPEYTLERHKVDFVCVGEGIDAFADFLKALSENGDLYNIPNIWGKKDGALIRNNLRPLIRNLEELPYLDWTIFDRRQFYKPFSGRIYIGGDHMLNWGCPHHCTYCINHFNHELYKNRGKYVMRRYSVERIIAELKYLKMKYNLEFFKFFDEDFLMRPLENLRELGDMYRREVNLPFAIETNPKSVTEEKAEILKDMNCAAVSLAIETGDLSVRKSMLNRVDSEADITKAFSLLSGKGIRTSAYNMLGLPFESRESYKKTVELNRKANPQYPNMVFFYPYEGTKLRDVAIKEGFFDPENEETIVYRYDKPALQFPDLPEEELIQMQRTFVLRVKLPECYEPFIRRSEIPDKLGREIRKKLLEIFDKTVWEHDGWYIDDGLEDNYLKELNELLQETKE